MSPERDNLSVVSDRLKMRPSSGWIAALGFAGLGIGAVTLILGVSFGLSAVLLALGALLLMLGVFRRQRLTTNGELADAAEAEAMRYQAEAQAAEFAASHHAQAGSGNHGL
jgi:hypothetical protein